MMSKELFFSLLCGVFALSACSASHTAAQPPLVATAGAPLQAAATRAKADAIQFAVIGDFGEAGPNEAAVSRLVHDWQPEFIVTVGDNNYPNGAADTIDDNIAQYYGDYIAFNPNYQGRYRGQGAAENRFFPVLGNHDWRTADLRPYFDFFKLPGNGRYYDFVRGPVHFFMVDSDPHEPDGVAPHLKQGLWLQAGLAQSQAAFKVVVMHHSPYSSGHHGSSRWMQWPYKAWGASVVLAGHNHCYEHIEVDGLNYIVNGVGGGHLSRLEDMPQLPGASIDIAYNKTHGAMHVHADRHAMTLDFFSIDNERVDTVTLTSAP